MSDPSFGMSCYLSKEDMLNAHIATLEAENARLKADKAALVEGLRRLIGKLPLHGEQGGPIIGLAAWYEDRTDARDISNPYGRKPEYSISHERITDAARLLKEVG